MAARLSTVSKEGFLYKKGGIIKSWSRRYFVLNPQSLCYFRSESHDKLEPLGRIFLSDIVSISTESTEKKKAFVFVLHTKKRAVLLQGANNEDRDKWVASIKNASEIDEEAEKQDPFRKSLRRLTPGVKRVTLFKDPARGIGCTIKNSVGRIYVNRIIEDGPIAETGILRPGDEILEIHGVPVTNKAVPEVVDIIKQCPTEFLATVRPIATVHKHHPHTPNPSRVDYSSIVHIRQQPQLPRHNNGGPPPPTKNGIKNRFCDMDSSDCTTSSDESVEYATVTKRLNGRQLESPIDDPPVPPRSTTPLTPPSFESQPSFEDVGNYDDEDEGDVPPPLPDWTEDALILVDPPPVPPRPEPKFNIYNTNAHLMPRQTNTGSSPATPQHSPYPKRKKKHSHEEHLSPSPRNCGSPVPSRRSPPNFPPPRPGKLLKSYSQDALNHIGGPKPPVPPRLKRHEPSHYSPEVKPRHCNALPRRVHLHNRVEIIEGGGGRNNVKYADLHFARDCVVGNGGGRY